MTATTLTHKQIAALTETAIEAVTLYNDDDAAPADLAPNHPEALALIDGLIQYANMLEAMLSMTRGSSPEQIRAAARVTARSLGERP